MVGSYCPFSVSHHQTDHHTTGKRSLLFFCKVMTSAAFTPSIFLIVTCYDVNVLHLFIHNVILCSKPKRWIHQVHIHIYILKGKRLKHSSWLILPNQSGGIVFHSVVACGGRVHMEASNQHGLVNLSLCGKRDNPP